MTAPSRAPAERVARDPSFASEVRHELALQYPSRACCQQAEVRGVLAAARSRPGPGEVTCLLTTSVVARKLVRLARATGRLGGGEEADGAGQVHFRRGKTPVRPTYAVTLRPAPRMQARVPARSCCRRAFIRAAFMTAGDVSIGPSGTHFEFRLSSARAADLVEATLRSLDLRPRRRRRGPRWLVYVKGSEDLVLLLSAMGASHAVLAYQNERILREVRGQANRVANSETANLRRSVATGLRQADAARRLLRSGLLDEQPQAIREMARLRMSAPTANLAELAARLHLSKSAVNARLRRLGGIAADLGLVD